MMNELAYAYGMRKESVHQQSIKLENKLNSGVLSDVYMAKMGSYPCVVKVSKPGKEDGLEEEIQIYERLGEHSGLLRYLGVTRVNDEPSLILEYFDGSKIEDRINSVLQSEDTQFKIGLQFLKTLDYVVSKGINYRDDFIRNIIVDSSGDMRLIDFNFSERQRIYSSYYSSYSDSGDYDKDNNIIHTGDFLYFLFTGIKPRVRYNKPVEIVNPGLDKRISEEVDRITQKCWNGGYHSVKTVISDFNELNKMRQRIHKISRDKQTAKTTSRKYNERKRENFINNNNLLQSSTKSTNKVKVNKMVNNNDITGLFKDLGDLVQSIYDMEKDPIKREKVKRAYEKQSLCFSDGRVDIGDFLAVSGTYKLVIGKEESKKVHLLFVEETKIDNLMEIARKNIELNENLNFWGKRNWYSKISHFERQKKRFFSKYDIGEGISYLNVSQESLLDNLKDGTTPLKPETNLSEFESLISLIGKMSARSAKRIGRQVLKIIESTPVSYLEKRPYIKLVRYEMLYAKVTEQEEWDKNHQPDFSGILKYFTESNGANNN